MVENASEDVEVLGTHPMFGPSVRSVRGQTVILVKPEGRTGELSRRVEGELRDSGANVQYATAEEHDEMMSVVQGLTHYAYIAVGGALERIDFEVDESRRFMSPVYEIMLDFVGRILHQNPYLYAEIQANQPVERVHDALLDSAEELARSVDEEDVEGFVDEMRDAARH
ncbi:MAG: prephenate dehydrogenase dimerization domain-containing protein, partial [Halobacteria archaeon]|nr:prephenate dehydrogenase dimerization domain-containing protein [Halobacteria archaeon]